MTFSEYLPVYRKNLTLAVPVIFSQIGQVTVNVVDNVMVGHLGTTELAAASFASSVFYVGLLFGLGITMGITPLVGQSLNTKNTSSLGSWLKNGLFINFIASVFLCVAMTLVVLFMNRMEKPRRDPKIEASVAYKALRLPLIAEVISSGILSYS